MNEDNSHMYDEPEIFPFDAYYDSERGAYLIQDADKNWMRISEKSLLLRLDMAGFTRKKGKDEKFSQAEVMLKKIQDHRNVMYTGPLAGYSSGMHIQSGYKVLVTHSPKVIEPYGEGLPTPLWDAFFEGAFVDGDIDQRPYVLTWLKTSYTSLLNSYKNGAPKNFSPGPVIALAGPRNSGKTLFISLVGQILGGRIAHPYRYMTGGSTFNKDIVGSELLVIDDEVASMDLRSRRHFAYQTKNMLFAHSFSCHGKNRDAFTLFPYWRVIVAVNDELENLHVLPPIDDSMEDKIMLIRFLRKQLPIPSNTPEERAELWGQFMIELPHFLNWLYFVYQPPEFAKDLRTGVKAYKHPDLLAALDQIDPAHRFWTIVEEALFQNTDRMTWEGTSEALGKLLTDRFPSARKLLDYHGAAGSYLGRMKDKYPERIIPFKLDKNTRAWRIMRDPEVPPTPFLEQKFNLD